MKRRNYIVVMMMGLLLGSCSSEDILSVPNGNGRIRFDVGVSQSEDVTITPMNGSATRSAEPLFLPTSSIEMHSGDMKMYANCASSADIPMHNIVPENTTRGSIKTEADFYPEFGIFGYFYDSSNKTWANNKSSLTSETSMNNLKVSQSSNSWTTDVYWPGASKKATFFAYAPYEANVSVNTNGAPKMTYTVPQNVAEQKDLLVAKSPEDIVCDGKTDVGLTFKHVLSAIKFVKGETPGYKEIKEIKISGVNNQGTLNMDSQLWESVSGNDTYTISSVDENMVCFLMPQTVPSDAKLSVTFANGATTQTFEADLDDTTWQAGHQYTYKLSVNKVTGTFNFEVSPSTVSVAIGGGSQVFTVKSYFKYTDGTKKPIHWNGSYTIGTTTTHLSGNGGDPGDPFIMTIGDNSSTTGDDSHTTELKSRTDINTVSGNTPYNLSNPNGASEVVNTANCYVVGRKGKYSIPLVYGCAIKGGAKNENAYGKGTYNSTSLNSTTFKTHNDEVISEPYIYDNPSSGTKYAPEKAELLWQDWSGLISSVTYNSSTKMIEFEIGEGIHQGNAIIVIKDESDILWSWHIWVTDRDISATIPIKCNDGTEFIYNFMQVPLGWCDTSSGASPRQITVSLTQDNSAKLATAVVNQAGAAATSGNAPYYQWGRKDPFCASVGTASTTTFKTLYNISKSTVSYQAINYGTVGNSIKNPGAFINGNSYYDWNSTICYDTWNAVRGNTDPSSDTDRYNHNKVVKSVYDPCPYGFKMPETKAFTGFTSNGANKTSSNYNNGTWTNNGWKFYTNGHNSGEQDFWIAGGYRNWYNSGSLYDVGSYGYYWSAGPYSNTYGCILYFNSSYVFPQYYNDRAYGFSVRPVSE